MDHQGLKGIAIALLFLLTLCAGLLPLRLGGASSGRRQRFLSVCNCFAGGVFFATCLLDLLPMIREKYSEAFTLAGITTVFPVAEFTTCMGFFLVLTIEQLVHTFHKKSFLHGSHGDEDSKKPLLDSSSGNDLERNLANGEVSSASNSFNSSGRRQNGTKAKNEESGIRTYILILALSMHSVFEGLALGLITDMDRLAQIAGAIVIHKSIIAFSLSVNLVQHEMPVKTVVKSAFLFSMMGPIGIAIGIAVLDSATLLSSSLSSAVLQGIANGTFLFVTFFEIFQRELSEKGHRLLKVLAMVTGYAIVTGLLYYANVLEHQNHNVHPNQSPPNATASPTDSLSSFVM